MEKGSTFYGPPVIFTEIIFDDIRRFYFSDTPITSDEIRSIVSAKSAPIQHKLFVVTEHLLSFKDLLLSNKHTGDVLSIQTVDGSLILDVAEEIELCGREYNGVDHDIEATCFYLLLTCIESTVCSPDHVDMASWLVKNWDDLCRPEENPKQCISRIKEDYYNQYGSRRRFIYAIIHNLPEDLKNRFVQSLAIVKLENHKVDKDSWDKWQNKNPDAKITSIADFLYDKVRSKFTHESHRSFFPTMPVNILPATQSNILISVVSPETDNLINLLQDTVRFLVRKYLLSV